MGLGFNVKARQISSLALETKSLFYFNKKVKYMSILGTKDMFYSFKDRKQKKTDLNYGIDT